MATYPELYVLRHGESVWNAEGRLQGRLDSPLTVNGREQARHQGTLLGEAGVNTQDFAFYSSPQGRARETADIALYGIGGVIRNDERLVEIGMGRLQSLTRSEIEQRFPDVYRETDPFRWYNSVPGGEGFDAVQIRVNSFLSSLKGPTVIVTHGIVSRFLRGTVLGLDRKGMGALRGGQGIVFQLKNGEQTCLE